MADQSVAVQAMRKLHGHLRAMREAPSQPLIETLKLRYNNSWFCFAVQAMRKLHGHLRAVREAAVGAKLPQARPAAMRPHADDLDAELDEAAQVQHELDDHLGCDVLGLNRGAWHAPIT